MYLSCCLNRSYSNLSGGTVVCSWWGSSVPGATMSSGLGVSWAPMTFFSRRDQLQTAGEEMQPWRRRRRSQRERRREHGECVEGRVRHEGEMLLPFFAVVRDTFSARSKKWGCMHVHKYTYMYTGKLIMLYIHTYYNSISRPHNTLPWIPQWQLTSNKKTFWGEGWLHKDHITIIVYLYMHIALRL